MAISHLRGFRRGGADLTIESFSAGLFLSGDQLVRSLGQEQSKQAEKTGKAFHDELRVSSFP